MSDPTKETRTLEEVAAENVVWDKIRVDSPEGWTLDEVEVVPRYLLTEALDIAKREQKAAVDARAERDAYMKSYAECVEARNKAEKSYVRLAALVKLTIDGAFDGDEYSGVWEDNARALRDFLQGEPFLTWEIVEELHTKDNQKK